MIVAAAVLIIAALGMVQFNKTANLHFHVDSYGRVISHSHPYDKSNDADPIKTHTHGKFDLTIMSGSVEMSVADWSLVTIQVPSVEVKQVFEYLPSREQDGLHQIRGRAPPFFTI